jgi:hypothetical protein
VAVASLLKAIDDRAMGKPFDLIVLTGDLVYSGKVAEFEKLRTVLVEPLRQSPLCQNTTFICVPGNHDLDCDVGMPFTWSGMGDSRQLNFFNFDGDGVHLRSTRAAAFKEYAEFLSKNNVLGVDPQSAPAQAHSINVRGKKIELICINTAFFSDREKAATDHHKAPMPVQPVRSLLQKMTPEVIPLILGHHPYTWFLHETADHFHSLLVDEKAIYLHGHEHTVMSKFGNRGLLSLGFGAAYQASPESTVTSYYRNSFAICELTESLHVAVTSWDNEKGKWRADHSLPADFHERSKRLEDGYVLALPSTTLSNHAASPMSALASAVRTELQIDNCIWLADEGTKRWTELLAEMGKISRFAESFSLPHKMLPVGHSQFRVKDSRSQYLIHAVSSAGDILNYEQIQKINTDLDTDDYDGCLVLTLGTLSKEAQTLALQLSSRKSMVVLERNDLVREAMKGLTSTQFSALASMQPDKVTISLIVTNSGLAFLCEDKTRHKWFSVLDEAGSHSSESSSLVCKLREENSALSRLQYGVDESIPFPTNTALATDPDFDWNEYRRRNHEYFDDVKYAPLAALGIRFNTTSLSEMYVKASADVGGGTKTSQNANRAVIEFVESLSLPKAQQEQLVGQLRARYGLERTAEVGEASQLYQRYNNIVVLGDPGSGKTCFVKNEILSYCTEVESDTWYSNHVPIYVALAEAAKTLDDKNDILDICQIQAARRGIDLPRNELEKILTEGRAAFFFDGLDEVGYIDKRISLMSEIGKLVKMFAGRGSRFVLASRPAAVQPVDVPEAFTYVQLKGLSENEMRLLAGKVMTARLGDSEDKGSLDAQDNDLIERLLLDTRNSPGIARIARNPLLLTLLVLIYANTGAVSAKRHMIYTQAIKTLVSVRGRDQREQQISEADLRTRLGALAAGIFRRDIDEIPRRSDVVGILTPLLGRTRQGDQKSLIEQTNSFIQEVAEATGLLSIHPHITNQDEDLITFMHYSFLEYYTATGLLSSDYSELLTRLSRNPRWKDVTTLMFGLLSDHTDVTDKLEVLLRDDTSAGLITKYKLLLAMDCASECDVPPEGAQNLLAEEIYNTIASGAGRFSTDLRDEIASRLRYFLQGAGPRIEVAILRGLATKDVLAKAAFCDLVSRIDSTVQLSKAIVEGFVESLAEQHPAVQTAAMLAIEAHPDLRGTSAEHVVKRALSGSISEKHAALKVLIAVPEFHIKMEESVMSLLDDANVLISELSANCLMINGLRSGSWIDKEKETLREKVLSKLNQSDQENTLQRAEVTIEPAIINSMLADENLSVRELALRYLPLLNNDARYVHRLLSRTMRTTDSARLKAAAMDSFRGCPSALDLITLADTDQICVLLTAGERNVRLAAIKLLGDLPDDEKVITSLKDLLESLLGESTRAEEITEAAKALAKHVRRNSRLREDILSTVLKYIPTNASSGFGDKTRQHHLRELLYVCESIGGVDDSTAQRVLRFAEDYRTPERIRTQSLRVFGRLAEPNILNTKKLCELLDKNDIRMRAAVYAAATSFIKRCRAKVEYVRRVNGELDNLREALVRAWARETTGHGESISPTGATEIRSAILEIENLTAAYEEFSERAQIREGQAEHSLDA